MLKRLLYLSIIFLLILSKFIKNDINKETVIESTYEYSDSYNTSECKSILIIPKIDLYKCMNINDVNKDIAILYDDKTTVLAAHSGTGSKAIFKDLYKLQLNDEVIFYHNGLKNIYYVVNIDKKLKKDNLSFENIDNRLIMITCSYTNKNEQIIYYLTKKEEKN